MPLLGRSANHGRQLRVLLGVVIWISLAAATFGLLYDAENSRGRRTLAHIQGWVFGQRIPIDLQFDRWIEAHVGDPVFFRPTNSDLTLIGEVQALLEGDRVLPARSASVRKLRCEIHLSVSKSTVTHNGVPTSSWRR